MLVIRECSLNRKIGVKKLPQSSIFEAGTASIAELFESHIENYRGNSACIALSISKHPLDIIAQDAIGKSLAALGYGHEACTYATLAPKELASNAHTNEAPTAYPPETASVGDDAVLDAQALFVLVEGLDPLFVIATDDASTHALEKAYRAKYELNSAIRVFGRPSAAFHDLTSLLETDRGKQQAWRLFKSFPKRT